MNLISVVGSRSHAPGAASSASAISVPASRFHRGREQCSLVSGIGSRGMVHLDGAVIRAFKSVS